jgi:hypothetical protein
VRSINSCAATGCLALVLLMAGCSSAPSGPAPVFNKPGQPDAIKKLITPEAAAPAQDGVAAAILLDTSGSMQDPVQGSDKKPKAKIKVAQDALMNLLQQFSDFGKKHPEKQILVGIYDFSVRKGRPSCRQVVKLGPPDLAAAQALIQGMTPSGGTPIGDAMITAKRDLQATGMSHQHILVISDGENNLGYMPGDVARVIAQEPDQHRAGIYFIAFDVGADLFDNVRDAGGMVLSANSEQQLTSTLDFILAGKILVEEPPPPPPHPSTIIRK